MVEKGAISEVVNGVVRGSWYVHGFPSSLRRDLTKRIRTTLRTIEFEKPTKLEAAVAALTALVEVGGYTYLAKEGINAYYFPLITNAVDLIGLGTYFKLTIKSYMNMTGHNIGTSWLG